MFVDLKSAFSIGPQHSILVKLAQPGVLQNTLHLIRMILRENLDRKNDDVDQFEAFAQFTGVAHKSTTFLSAAECSALFVSQA